MATQMISSDLSQVTDDTLLLHPSLDSPYTPHTPYRDVPARSSDSYDQIPETEAYSFLDLNLQPPARDTVSPAGGHTKYHGVRDSSLQRSQPSLSVTHEDDLKLQERVSRDKESPDWEASGNDEDAKPTTLSSSKGSFDLVVAMVLLVLCLPFCFVLGYATYLNKKPVDEKHWILIQHVLKIV